MRNRSASKFNALRFAYTSRKHSIAVHSCELLKGSQSYLPKLPPNAKYFVRLKRQFQKMILVSAKHPYTRFYLRSHAAIAFEKKRHGRSPHWWVVHPYSIFRFYWDLFMLFILLHLVTAIPHMLAYAVLGDSCRLDSSVLHAAFAFCWMDIVVNCITGFTSADEHEIYLDPGLIMRHYSRGFFLVDVLSSIPYSPCSEKHLEKLNINFVYIFFQLLPLLKVFRLATVRQYIKKLNVALGISDMCDLYIWIVVLTTLICHWSACLSYGFPHFVKLATRGDIRKMGVWFVDEHLRGIELWELYLRCLHVGASNLWSFDFSEVTYEATPDRIVRCVLLIFGKGYTIYVIVALLQLIESHAEPEMKYHKMMYQVQDYARQKKLPKELHDRLVEYYEYRYQGSYYKESGIINTLPNHLKQEIVMQSSRGLLDNAKLFYNVSRTLVGNIITSLKSDICLDEDVIYVAGSQGDCMYFVISGTVALISFFGKEICHLQDGDHFGEIALIYPDRHRDVSAIACEVCELLRFDRRDFNRLVPPNSLLFTRLEKIAQERLATVVQMNKLTKEAERRKRKEGIQNSEQTTSV